MALVQPLKAATPAESCSVTTACAPTPCVAADMRVVVRVVFALLRLVETRITLGLVLDTQLLLSCLHFELPLYLLKCDATEFQPMVRKHTRDDFERLGLVQVKGKCIQHDIAECLIVIATQVADNMNQLTQ